MISKFIETNSIKLHYLDRPAEDKPVLILLHGLTANAHAFDGLVSHGLNENFHLITPDLRGRGLSDKPAFQYTLEEHAEDILGLIEGLKLKKVFLGGHSYGGLLSTFIAAHYPKVVKKLILIDAAMQMNDKVLDMLGPTLARLDKTFKNIDVYMKEMKAAPQNTFWDKDMESYYKADANVKEDGTVNPYPNLANILEVSANVGLQDWPDTFKMVSQASLLINGVDNYTLDEPLLPDFRAKETAAIMKKCTYVKVLGNHQTMLYGKGAKEIVEAINNFLD